MKLRNIIATSLFCALIINNTAAQTTIYTQTFTGSLPAGWVKTDLSGTNAGNWQWTNTKPLNWSNSGFTPNTGPIMSTSSTGYMMFDSNGQNSGTNDNKPEKADLISPAINLSGYNSINLKFEDYYWHTYSDTISVWISTDGTNFTNVWTCFSDTCDSDFNTGRGDTINIDISSIADNQPTVYLKFRWIGNYDLFWAVDDIKITGNLATGLIGLSASNELISFPNPVNDKVTIRSNQLSNTPVKIDIIDSQGKLNKTIFQESLNQETSLDLSDLLKGIYLIKITGNNFNSVKRIIKN